MRDQGLGQFLGTGRFKQNFKKLKEMIWFNVGFTLSPE